MLFLFRLFSFVFLCSQSYKNSQIHKAQKKHFWRKHSKSKRKQNPAEIVNTLIYCAFISPCFPLFSRKISVACQGLEVDFACILWDADLQYENGRWTYWKFNGKDQWIPENNVETQKYMLNAYRVLLTRARQGMVICVPEGNDRTTPEGFPEDSTRVPSLYDPTYEYFKQIGMSEL